MLSSLGRTISLNDKYCRNQFRIPDVPDEICLLLCRHLNLLTLIFTHQAFPPPNWLLPNSYSVSGSPRNRNKCQFPLRKRCYMFPSSADPNSPWTGFEFWTTKLFLTVYSDHKWSPLQASPAWSFPPVNTPFDAEIAKLSTTAVCNTTSVDLLLSFPLTFAQVSSVNRNGI